MADTPNMLDVLGRAPRPTPYADAVLATAADSLMEELTQAGESEGAVEDVLDALHNSEHDGYALACYLEREHYWAPNADLVSALDEASSHIYHARAEHVRAWVAQNHVVVPHRLGARVRIEHERCEYEGIVADIDRAQALVTVRVPALGHVAEGLGTHGFILPAEDVKEVARV